VSRFLAHDRRVLSHRQYEDEIVSGDFRNGVAVQAQLKGVHFKEAQLDCFNFTNSAFLDCSFTGCSMMLSGFNASAFKNVTFLDCNLDQARFQLAHFENVTIEGGRAEYANFEDAWADDLTLDTQLHGAVLTFVKKSKLSFGNSNLWGAVIRADCTFFNDTQMDRRAIALFLNLLASTKGNKALAELTTEKEQKLARRLIRAREA
jgi:uncharacterized protein YjbI with pentapeptide repeats